MIKTIFFDFDGVLTLDRTGSVVTSKYLAKKLKLPMEHVKKIWEKSNDGGDEGINDTENIWKKFCGALDIDLNINMLPKAWSSLRFNKPIFELMKKLRKNYKIGLISDNPQDRFEFLDKKFGINRHFDFVTVSCYVHAIKTESEKIFDDALQKSGYKPSECVFIDNKAANLEIPKRLGFKTILYDTTDHNFDYLLDKLKEVGVKI